MVLDAKDIKIGAFRTQQGVLPDALDLTCKDHSLMYVLSRITVHTTLHYSRIFCNIPVALAGIYMKNQNLTTRIFRVLKDSMPGQHYLLNNPTESRQVQILALL